MQGLSVMVSAATLFSVLCLQLGINIAQETTNVPKPLSFDLKVPSTAKPNEMISVELRLTTEYKECFVAKAYLVSSEPMEGAFNYVQTRCLCIDFPASFFWDFEVTRSVYFKVVVDLTKEKGICPDDYAVIPITANRFYTERYVHVS
ncbi:prolactin-inducible protein homolog [Acomys russatus]|uniref:prolactin-inducible protein homolog n=1 Tax=Acomys russatus TaxID=60746 RepID=UPI0021E1D20D|nr:prolactin-inducible protein homolog [Acomys russatus]